MAADAVLASRPRPILRGSPLCGERLRMTEEIFSFINIKFFIPYPRPQNLAYPAHVLSDEGRF
jgi:hypothetical protein